MFQIRSCGLMHHTLTDIGNFIFISDGPEQADAIFVVGGSLPELPELAAELWKNGYAPLVFIGGGVSIKRGSFPGRVPSGIFTIRITRRNMIFIGMCCCVQAYRSMRLQEKTVLDTPSRMHNSQGKRRMRSAFRPSVRCWSARHSMPGAALCVISSRSRIHGSA